MMPKTKLGALLLGVLSCGALASSASAAGRVGDIDTGAFALVNLDGDATLDAVLTTPTSGGCSTTGQIQIDYDYDLENEDFSSDVTWTRDSSGMLESADCGDYFGASIAAGDFDGDGYDDLAIGVPGDDVSSQSDAGSVHIMYGSASGVTATGDQVFHQDTSGIQGAAEANDFYGEFLTVGDFDCDGYDDLAVGIPREAISTNSDAGMVNVIYGSASGLTATGDQGWNQDTAGIPGASEAGDEFGGAVSVGNWNDDAQSDVSTFVPQLSSAQPGSHRPQRWVGSHSKTTASDLGVPTSPRSHIGCADLAIGVPGEDLSSLSDAGMVVVIYGGVSSGLTATGSQSWHQDTSGIAETAESGDEFGASLLVVQDDTDGIDDLWIGTPGEGCAGDDESSNWIRGSGSGLTTTSNWQECTDEDDPQNVACSPCTGGHHYCNCSASLGGRYCGAFKRFSQKVGYKCGEDIAGSVGCSGSCSG